jgi:secreted trypsin-like serine protease
LALPGVFPFIVQLFDKDQNYNFCGGSLIGPYHVLTAAHCIEGSEPSSIQIWAGALNLFDADGYKVNVAVIYEHPDYDRPTITNDVAVLKLSKPFPQSVGVRTINLAATAVAPGTLATSAGWGNTGTSYPEDLMFVKTVVQDNSVCTASYGSFFVASQEVCAHDPGQGTCFGDSGGPFFTGTKLKANQHGVVSYVSGNGCATAPSVYARVTAYREWIVEQTDHVVSTTCAGCATIPHWRDMCKSIGGFYQLVANGYQCRNLDVLKVRKINYEWDDCADTKVKDLCDKIGFYECINNIPTCTRL